MKSPGKEGVNVGFNVDGSRCSRIGVFFEIGNISETLDNWDVTCLDFLLEEIFPTEVVEPAMLLDVVDA
jgi:hypothetical protein